MTTALYGQDAYSIGRLTVFGGIRWERIEGYLPAQTTPDSQYFPDGLVFSGVTINGVVQNYTVRKSFDDGATAIRCGTTSAPRVSGTFDLTGDGKSVIKASWGEYLDQINTGTPPNPNANINQVYAWNDLNGDFIFQTRATPRGTACSTSAANSARCSRPTTSPWRCSTRRAASASRGNQRQLRPRADPQRAARRRRTSARASATRRARSIRTSISGSQLFTQSTLTDPGRDGVLRHR